MPKITDQPLKVIQVRIFERDYQRLQEMFSSDPTFSMNKAVRTMIHTMLNQMEARINSAIDHQEANAPGLPAIDLPKDIAP